MQIITLTTDYGLRDYSVAAVKGALYRECPTATIVDISHQISSIQSLKDRNSMQMLHYLNLEQSAIQNNILSIKTQMIEMAQA